MYLRYCAMFGLGNVPLWIMYLQSSICARSSYHASIYYSSVLITLRVCMNLVIFVNTISNHRCSLYLPGTWYQYRHHLDGIASSRACRFERYRALMVAVTSIIWSLISCSYSVRFSSFFISSATCLDAASSLDSTRASLLILLIIRLIFRDGIFFLLPALFHKFLRCFGFLCCLLGPVRE